MIFYYMRNLLKSDTNAFTYKTNKLTEVENKPMVTKWEGKLGEGQIGNLGLT